MPRQERVLEPRCWRQSQLRPGLGHAAQPLRMPRSNPTYATCCPPEKCPRRPHASALGIQIFPLLGPLTGHDGQAKTQALGLHKNRMSGFSDHCVPLSRAATFETLPSLTAHPHTPGACLRESSRPTPPGSVLWVPLL